MAGEGTKELLLLSVGTRKVQNITLNFLITIAKIKITDLPEMTLFVIACWASCFFFCRRRRTNRFPNGIQRLLNYLTRSVPEFRVTVTNSRFSFLVTDLANARSSFLVPERTTPFY